MPRCEYSYYVTLLPCNQFYYWGAWREEGSTVLTWGAHSPSPITTPQNRHCWLVKLWSDLAWPSTLLFTLCGLGSIVEWSSCFLAKGRKRQLKQGSCVTMKRIHIVINSLNWLTSDITCSSPLSYILRSYENLHFAHCFIDCSSMVCV